ncbi:LPXTG cell wall anchor domain-containing protein [Micromonospora costi]|uniref:LPXTG cell wall anchor domain-containing protein n=1 Tax=Micromonospora costi TaxID=1530042 RepID=A0A3B0AGE4_9ACTN|nr:LPXTG cell wall anchor domain-containing protein [Micromonospora costi]RKN58717.1 LPXTG cell wall anchor domain-containing protein [Micromonospora costi]
MRWKLPAGVLMALAFLIPAAPAMAQTEPPVLNEACQTVERKLYKDIRELVTIDLDTATNVEVRVLANQILAAANADSLPRLPAVIQDRLDGTSEDLRAFLKADVQVAWSTDLRITVIRTLTGAGAKVKAAAQTALDEGTVDAYLAYLNNGLYAARALDCAQPAPTPTLTSAPTPSATPSATTTAPAPASSASLGAPGGGEGGGLPVTGAGTGTVASIGGVLLLLGGAGYLVGRRRRSRFVA